MRLALRFFAFVTILFAFLAPATAMDENELVMKIRNFKQQIVGASDPTKTRVAEKLSAEISGQPITVQSAVVVKFYEKLVVYNGRFIIKPEMSKEYDPTLRDMRPGPWALLEKSYQDFVITYYVRLDSDSLVDSCRIGQKVSLEGVIAGAGNRNGYEPFVYSGDAHWGFVVASPRIQLETHALRCPNGHEYAPSAGYKFCPQDGLPLK